MVQRFEVFVNLINTVYKDLQKIKSYEVKKLGLKSSHVMCMFYLAQNSEGLTLNELCDMCREDKAAVSRNLKFLYEKGYVATSGEESQKYKLHNVLTDKGKEVYANLEEIISAAVERFSKGLSTREREAFSKYLGKIIANFEDFFDEKREDNQK